MVYEWDDDKTAINFAKHGVSFSVIEYFDWSSAIVKQDTRKDYGETRFMAFGKIGSRLHVAVYTKRSATIRVIGLRKANSREVKRYEDQT
jgi:uncharacterized DUF497 family protein